MKKILLRLKSRQFWGSSGYIFICLTIACGIIAKLIPDNTPWNNFFDILEIVFFFGASFSCWKYITL